MLKCFGDEKYYDSRFLFIKIDYQNLYTAATKAVAVDFVPVPLLFK
jgi:hypothetical protein